MNQRDINQQFFDLIEVQGKQIDALRRMIGELAEAIESLVDKVHKSIKEISDEDEDIHYCNDVCSKFPGHRGIRDPRES